MKKNLKNKILYAERLVYKAENLLLVIGLTVMMTLGATQVFLRNFFNTAVDWADLLVRALVLWLGFMGASIATRKMKHINIDAATKFIKNEKLESLRKKIVLIISLGLCLTLLYASIDYTIIEAENQMTAFLGVPTWVVFIIVPISLATISLRMFLLLFVNIEEGEAL